MLNPVKTKHGEGRGVEWKGFVFVPLVYGYWPSAIL